MSCTWLTAREVGEYIQVSSETIHKWVKQGKLKGSMPEGTRILRVCLKDLQDFMGVEDED